MSLAWAEVLDQILAALSIAEAQALRAEEALAPLSVAASPTVRHAESPIDRVQTCLAQAERIGAEAESRCRAAEEALTRWLDAAAAVRRRLATEAKPSL